MTLTSRTRILLTGGSGMLGKTIYERFSPHYTVYQLGRQLPESPNTIVCDIADTQAFVSHLDRIKPQLVFHCAAMTNLEYCENHPHEAYQVNVAATQAVSKWCQKQMVPFVFISTAGIFDGVKDFYVEGDTAHPITVYGKTKFEAEQLAKQAPLSYIFRAGWMVGGGPGVDKKMVARIMEQVKSGTTTIQAVDDMFGTITYTEDFVTTMTAVIHEEAYGLYHVSSPERVSRFDMAQQIISLLQVPIEVKRVPSSFFAASYFVKRPQSECLNCDKLIQMKLLRHRNVKEVFQEYLSLWQ